MKALGKTALLSASALVTSIAALPSTATAQSAPVEDETSDSGGIEEIIVTARKTQETLQSAPVAVSVVTADKIEEFGLTSIDDFAKQANGISFSQAFGRFTDRPVIRGASNVLANVQFGVETGAAYFVDGVYFQGDLQSFDPSSIERVEIVKGPQSALYGRNTYSGAINYITKDPGNDFGATANARIAEHGEKQFSGSVSGPIIKDILKFRLGGRYYDYSGEFVNQLTGKKVGQENSKSVDLTMVFTPHDDVKMRTRISYQKDNDGARAFFLQGAAANNCLPGYRSIGFRGTGSAVLPFGNPGRLITDPTNRNQWFCGVVRPQPNNIRLNTEATIYPGGAAVPDGTAFDGITNKQINVSNVFDWDLGGSGFTLSSLTGLRINRNASGSDSDHSEAYVTFGAPGEPLFAASSRSRQLDFSQELTLSTPQDKPIRAKVGGYYFKQDFNNTDILFQDPLLRTGSVDTLLGQNNSQFATIDNRAIFGSVEWDITDALSITAELRHAVEKKTIIDRSSPSATGAYIFAAGVDQGRLTQFGCTPTLIARLPVPGCKIFPTGEFKGTDPRITVNYTTAGGTLLYANYATGRKPGGFNGTAGITAQILLNRPADSYQPEKSKGFELGVKFSALDKRLFGTLALYSSKLSNVQLSTAIPNPGAGGSLTSIVTTAGNNAKTSGFEASFQAAPTKGLNISMGISYVNAKFTSGCDADLFIYNSGGLRPNFDTSNPPAAALALCSLKGKKLPLGSPITVNGSIAYETEIGSGGMKIFGNSNFSYEDSKFIQTDNFAKTVDAFLLNGRIGIKTDNFTIAVFGRNLTNEDSIPLATRWFDLRYGSSAGLIPPGLTFNGAPAVAETGSPRGLFGALRKSRTFGLEASFKY
jgi:iron complex outermembrane recepter protein